MKRLSPLFMILAIASNSLCQNVPWFGDDPSDEIVVSNGDTFVFRELNTYLPELFTGAETSEPHAHASHGQELAEYLSQPHPSVSTIRSYFSMAAQEFNVPVQLLEAIGQVENNWTQIGPSIDQGWGVMHLVQNGYCNTLTDAATLLDLPEQELKNNALQNIRGAAALLDSYAINQGINRNNAAEWFLPMARFSGLINEKLRRLQAKEYYKVLQSGVESYTLWGEVISMNGDVHISLPKINLEDYSSLEIGGGRSSDYGPALTDWAASCNYGTGRNHSIDTWVNHWADGTYYGTISWFQTCPGSGAGQRGYDNNGNLIGASSAHFVINNTNGEITQMVAVSNTAWHCGASGQAYNNGRAIGVEHAVQSSNPSQWNSASMLNASATMACYFQQQYGFPTTQNSSPGICGHNDMPGTNTSCPGPLPWSTWYSYFNNANCSGGGGCMPDNDNCSSATLITSNGSCLSGTVECATGSYGANNCGNGTSIDDNDVYYRFVAQATSHTVTISNYANNFDGVIELRTACASGSGNYISCYDPSGAPSSVSYTWYSLTIGQTYYIRVYEFNSTTTPPNSPTFDICVTHSGGGGEPNLTRVSGISTINVNGNNLDVSIRVINDGGATSGSSTVCYYLSTNTDISSSDYLVGTDNVSSLSVNGTSNESISVDVCTVSPQIPNGTYYVGYIIDCGDDVNESNESDNEFYFVNTQITVNCVAPCTPPNNPSSASASPSTINSGSSSTLTVNGGSLGSSSQWIWYSGSCGGTQVGTGSQLTVNPTNTTTYWVRAVGSGDCAGQNTSCESVTVNVNAPCTAATDPSSASASPTTINSGSSSSLTVNGGSLGSSAQWVWYSGSCGGSQIGTGSQITVNPTSTTTYWVRAVGSGDCVGQNTSCESVTVNVSSPCTPSVSVTSSAGNSICAGDQITFTATPTNGGQNPSYTWIDGGSIVGFGPTWSSSILTTGNHNVQVEMTSNESCANPQTVYSNTLSVMVNPIPSTPSINPSNPPVGCNPVTLAATSNSGCTYSWATPNGTVSTGTGNQLSATQTGQYSVIVTCNGCASSTSSPVAVTINSNVTASFTGLGNGAFCEDANALTLTGNPSGGTFSGSGVINGNQFDPSQAGAGTHTVTYTYSDGSGCSASPTQQVTVHPLPVANAGSDVSISQGGSTPLGSSSGVSCSWSPPTDLNDSNDCFPTASPSATTIYTLTVTDANGCVATDNVEVTVEGCNYSLSDYSEQFTASSGGGSFDVTTDNGCTWTASSECNWVTITSGFSGDGNGTVTYSVAANIGGAQTCNINVGGEVFVVSQDGPCSYSLSDNSEEFTASGGTGSFNVTGTPNNCGWTATPNCNWVNITSGANGVGAGTVTYTVDSYSGSSTQTCEISIWGETYTITQTGTGPDPCDPNPLSEPVLTLNGCELSSPHVNGVSYQWYVSGNMVGNGTRFHSVTEDGTYYLVITDGNGCTAQSTDLFVQCGVGIEENDAAVFQLIPNPSQGQFELVFPNINGLHSYTVHSGLGQLVADGVISSERVAISLSDAAAGVYTLRVLDAKGQAVGVRRAVVTRP